MEEQDYQCLLSESFLTYYSIHLDNNPDSLICRFYGVFSVYQDNSKFPIRLILMRNLKYCFKRLIRGTYDLKGSTMNRKVVVKCDSKAQEFTTVKKDLNFDEEIGGLDLKKEDKEKFIQNITDDSTFFEDLGIMDYSLFIFRLEYTDEEMNKFVNSQNFIFYKRYFYQSEEILNTRDSGNFDQRGSQILVNINHKGSQEIFQEEKNSSASSINNLPEYRVGYLIMIIDYLQLYNFNKKMERGFKDFFGGSGIASAAPPNEYSKRFIEYCKIISGKRSLQKLD